MKCSKTLYVGVQCSPWQEVGVLTELAPGLGARDQRETSFFGYFLELEGLLNWSSAMAGYATQPLVGADSVKIFIYQLALLYKG